MQIVKQYDLTFDKASSECPYMAYPKVFEDDRGSFSEVLVEDSLKDIKQINRSKSQPMVLRGCHAQSGKWCQAKLVEAINKPIYDIITDARPDSSTFGTTAAYLLDPVKQNKLYVPRGFLHAFAVPPYEGLEEAIFMYYCDNVFHKDAEICISPMSLLPKVVQYFKYDADNIALCNMLEDSQKLILSEKDNNGLDYGQFMEDVSSQYATSNILWYV